MIIECINCNKKFKVDSDLIPDNGRTIQCGSCNHIWFFKKNEKIQKNTSISKSERDIVSSYPEKQENQKNISKIAKKVRSLPKKDLTVSPNKGSEIIKYQSTSRFTITRLLSIILVLIISFIGIIIIIDTFKSPLFRLFPKLEFLLFSLFETLKDIELFIRDLI